MFISEDNHHIFKMLLLGFRYRTTHHLYPPTKTNSVGHEGVCYRVHNESEMD